MNILIIEVADRETINQRFKEAAAGQPQGNYVSFPSIDLLHKVMTPRRWEIIKRLQVEPTGLRALARALELDPGNLQRDIQPLKSYGIVVDADLGLSVPYDEVRLELISKAA